MALPHAIVLDFQYHALMTSATSSGSPIDTARVSNRRTLRFQTADEAATEAQRLASAERGGNLTPLGNWTLGQALGHLATWAEFSFTGAPLKLPLPIRLMVRLQKNKFLTRPMPAGVKISRVPGGTLGIDRLPLDDGLAKYCAAMDRLKNEAPTKPNVIFGPLTHEQWIQLNLRHAELHLSFFRPVTD